MRVGLLQSFCLVVVVLFRNFSGVLIDLAWFRLFGLFWSGFLDTASDASDVNRIIVVRLG
jgi:hypothetical protein